MVEAVTRYKSHGSANEQPNLMIDRLLSFVITTVIMFGMKVDLKMNGF